MCFLPEDDRCFPRPLAGCQSQRATWLTTRSRHKWTCVTKPNGIDASVSRYLATGGSGADQRQPARTLPPAAVSSRSPATSIGLAACGWLSTISICLPPRDQMARHHTADLAVRQRDEAVHPASRRSPHPVVAAAARRREERLHIHLQPVLVRLARDIDGHAGCARRSTIDSRPPGPTSRSQAQAPALPSRPNVSSVRAGMLRRPTRPGAHRRTCQQIAWARRSTCSQELDVQVRHVVARRPGAGHTRPSSAHPRPRPTPADGPGRPPAPKAGYRVRSRTGRCADRPDHSARQRLVLAKHQNFARRSPDRRSACRQESRPSGTAADAPPPASISPTFTSAW